jgi:hypothetical protein
MKRVTAKICIALVFLVTIWSLRAQTQSGTVVWSYDVGSAIVSSPAVSQDGTIYVGSSAALYAITNAGSVASNKWTFGAGLSLDNSSPAIGADGTIYFVGSASNALFAVNPDGIQKWSLFKGGGGGTPAIGLDNTIYFQDYTGFYAITRAGEVRWKLLVGDSQPSSPVIGPDGTVYISSWEFAKICAISPDGSQKWCRDLSSSPGDSPAISTDGVLFVPGQPLCALARDGTRIWSLDLAIRLDGPPVIGEGGTLYVAASGSHTLYAVDSSGKVIWHALESASRVPSTAPALDDAGNVYYCVSNSVVALGAGGDVLWTVYGGDSSPGLTLAVTSPVLGPDGTVYAALGSKLYAIVQTNRPAGSSWPMYHQNARHTGKIEKPSLQKPQRRADANFQFQLYAQIDQAQTVQASTDLVSWAEVTNVVVTNVPMTVVDLSATNFPSRFYRTVSR